MEFRATEIEEVAELVPETQKVVKMLKSAKTNAAKDAYYYLASLPAEILAFIEVEMPNPRALSKIRNYLQKWRPLRMALARWRTRRAGRRAWSEIRQDRRTILRTAIARQGQDARRPHQDSQESRRNQRRNQKAGKERKKAQGSARSSAARGSKRARKIKGRSSWNQSGACSGRRRKTRARRANLPPLQRSPGNRRRPRSAPRLRPNTIKLSTTTRPRAWKEIEVSPKKKSRR